MSFIPVHENIQNVPHLFIYLFTFLSINQETSFCYLWRTHIIVFNLKKIKVLKDDIDRRESEHIALEHTVKILYMDILLSSSLLLKSSRTAGEPAFKSVLRELLVIQFIFSASHFTLSDIYIYIYILNQDTVSEAWLFSMSTWTATLSETLKLGVN